MLDKLNLAYPQELGRKLKGPLRTKIDGKKSMHQRPYSWESSSDVHLNYSCNVNRFGYAVFLDHNILEVTN